MKKPTQKPAAPAPKQSGPVDVDKIINDARAKIPPQLGDMFDKIVLSGMRVMFDKNSHKMMLDELNKPGPMATRISNGIISLIYILWNKSNHTMPPQLIVPATFVLTLRAFQFLQDSKDPEATPAVLGEAVADSVQGVMDRFGATQDKIPALLRAQQAGQGPAPGAPAPSNQPDPSGLLAAANGGAQ